MLHSIYSSLTAHDTGSFSTRLVVRQDGGLAAVGGVEAKARTHLGAAGTATLAALNLATRAFGLDAPYTVAAGACHGAIGCARSD